MEADNIVPDNELPAVLVALMKGVVARENAAAIWHALLLRQARVREYVALIGLEVCIDETEGFAYLRQRREYEGQPEIPRLITRRSLSYPVSLLLALLRKRLVEFDAGSESSGSEQLILESGQIADLMRLFLPESANEVKLLDRIDSYLEKIVELGFLRRLRGSDDRYEVRRVLKAFVDAQWLQEFNARLIEYRDYAATGGRSAVAPEDI